MRSGEPKRESSRPRKHTLARRLTWTLVSACAIAVSLAIVAVLSLADAMIRKQVEHDVEAQATVLAVEVDEKTSLIDDLDEEARELGIEGRVAIVDTRTVGRSQAVACGVLSAQGIDELICRRTLEHDPELTVLVAIPAARLDEHRRPMLIAGLAVLLVVALGSALVGWLLARRMLGPLERLRRAVGDIDAGSPKAVELPGDSQFEELEALREAIASLIARLDAELERTQRFSSAAAHELRTPLTKIHAELELVLEGDIDPVVARATFERLFRTTDHLVTLSERVLTLALPREAFTRDHAVSLASLAEALLERRSPDDAGRLTIETGEADGLVRGDEVLLAAMLDNVVDNALKFSSGPVRVAVFERDGEVIVEVDDEGPGVAPELAAELFEPFRRSPNARDQAGLGLGLALVARIAEGHGGLAEFVAGRERGASLRIRLPGVTSR